MTKGLQKIKFAILLALCYSQVIFACDVCSCGSSNSNNLNGGLSNNYIGLSFNFLHFSFKEGVANNSPIADDYIRTISINGQYFINNKIQINAVIPHRINSRVTSNQTVNNNGLGDITLYGLYNTLSHQKKHSLKFGAGLKLPTGKFDISITDINKTSAIQLGTGSLDVLVPIQYKFKSKKVVFNLNGTYFFKNKNSNEFKYGNQIQLNSRIGYKVNIKSNYTIIPSIGLIYDDFKASERFEIIDKRSSGNMTNANFSLQAYLNKIVLGLNYFTPLKQNLIEKEVTFVRSMGVSLNYLF